MQEMTFCSGVRERKTHTGKKEKAKEKTKRTQQWLQMRWGYAMIRERGGKTCEKNLYDPERFKIL